jgi:hypothetical protein
MANTDFKKEWFTKAEIDYFSPFVNLWLACNSWYKFHYDEKLDRDYINKIKSDLSGSNKLYAAFEKRYCSDADKDASQFLGLLQQLHYATVRAEIKPERFMHVIGFQYCLIDYSLKAEKDSYKSIMLKTEDVLNKNGQFKKGKTGIKLSNEIVLSDNNKMVFAGLIEIIYQVRNALIHGDLNPNDDNHEVVKYCYLILYELLKDFCK